MEGTRERLASAIGTFTPARRESNGRLHSFSASMLPHRRSCEGGSPPHHHRGSATAGSPPQHRGSATAGSPSQHRGSATAGSGTRSITRRSLQRSSVVQSTMASALRSTGGHEAGKAASAYAASSDDVVVGRTCSATHTLIPFHSRTDCYCPQLISAWLICCPILSSYCVVYAPCSADTIRSWMGQLLPKLIRMRPTVVLSLGLLFFWAYACLRTRPDSLLPRAPAQHGTNHNAL